MTSPTPLQLPPVAPQPQNQTPNIGQILLNKVPEITLYFWIIKILCTTVGETAADFLNIDLNFGLVNTSILTGVLLVGALIFQFRAKRYIPSLYWLTVALVSVFGTLVTDNLTDKLGVPLEVSTIVFGVLLAINFIVWYRQERTLSIHSITTRRRETFYWLTVLFTFALGTASGDLMAEGLALGYTVTGLIIAGLIAIIAVGWKTKLHPVLAFWLIYILTRPLGASIGDFLSQPTNHGGLGLGATWTSVLFLTGIAGIVAYLSATKKDVITQDTGTEIRKPELRNGLIQTISVVLVLAVIGGITYGMRQSALQTNTPSISSKNSSTSTSATSENTSTTAKQTETIVSSQSSPLGDLSNFRVIVQDTLDLVNSNDQSGARKRIKDLESEWDAAESTLKPKDRAAWTIVDDKIDTALSKVRSKKPNQTAEESALRALLKAL